MFIPNKISFTYSGVTCSVISSSFLHILFKQYPLPYFLFENIMNNTFGLTHSLFQKWVISKSVWSPCLPQSSLQLHQNDSKAQNIILVFNPIRAGGGWISPPFFQMAISPWQKGVWRSKISWLFLIHYELSEKQKKFFRFFTVF